MLIDPLPLVVFKNIVPITEHAILYLISQSLDDRGSWSVP